MPNYYSGLFLGKCSKDSEEMLTEARNASDLLGLRDLAYILTNMINGEGYLNKDVEQHFHDRRCQRLLDLFVGTGKLAGKCKDLGCSIIGIVTVQGRRGSVFLQNL